MIEKAKNVAIGIILLIAIVIPFISLAAVSNTTATPTVLGLPSTAFNAIMLLIVIGFVFYLVKTKSSK